MRQDGNLTFDECKEYYSKLNSTKLSIKITENRNGVSNLNLGYPKFKKNSNRPNYEPTWDIKDNEGSYFTYAEINNNKSFSDLSEKKCQKLILIIFCRITTLSQKIVT